MTGSAPMPGVATDASLLRLGAQFFSRGQIHQSPRCIALHEAGLQYAFSPELWMIVALVLTALGVVDARIRPTQPVYVRGVLLELTNYFFFTPSFVGSSPKLHSEFCSWLMYGCMYA